MILIRLDYINRRDMSDEMEVQSTNLKRLRSDESETDLILHKMSKESKTKKK